MPNDAPTFPQRILSVFATTASYLIAVSMLLALSLFILNLYFTQFGWPLGNKEDFGAFGDYIGGTLNPILGFITVVLLIWSLRTQQKELALTRQELADTKRETELSRKAMQAQVKHLEREAKLNELMRMLDGVRSDNRLLLSKRPQFQSYTCQVGFDVEVNPNSYEELLIIKAYEIQDDDRIYVTSDLYNSSEDTRTLVSIYNKTVLQLRLVNKYIELSPSKELADMHYRELEFLLSGFQILCPDIIEQYVKHMLDRLKLARR
ncbi:hypothetical protein AYI74_10000 [Shewanella algae]|uniref:hypothetical protein n=1 Tax=Shewanella algae TaxID=38313 RepID=UPI000D65805F|nr:hypothetical protein [Shewanella algae]MBO2644706.1 hypothetical protein [Shewanella algae]PWF89924.1 hypothetical protein DD549_21455 [Shewanella algae]TWU68429.1 hypothetical protein AYI74_10000 [Shewanella algae]